MPVEAVGGFAGVLCTVSFIPQVVKIYRSRNARDISLPAFCAFSAGVFVWFIYGIMIKDIPVMATNILIFILSLAIVFMKMKYKDIREIPEKEEGCPSSV